ncbi:MAG: hypothetical protein R3281_10280 [Balneolaceae bacterium]|nr:hypothetical protein [Balneolaceae bacterium]
MDIDTPSDTFKNISFKKQDQFKKLVSHLEENVSSADHHLCLFLGLYEQSKKKALKQVAQATGLEVKKIDFNDIISKVEQETYDNLDELFYDLDKKQKLIYFTNGDKLCGAYTGFTHSKVKYATPQERYFLKKVKDFEGLVIIDISEYDNADETMLRAAQSIVKFPLPDSRLQRFWWHLKHYSLHGFDIKTKRPDRYLEGSV